MLMWGVGFVWEFYLSLIQLESFPFPTPPPMLMPAGRVGVTGSVWVEGFKSQACRFGNRVFPSYLSSRNDREIGAFPRLVQALF